LSQSGFESLPAGAAHIAEPDAGGSRVHEYECWFRRSAALLGQQRGLSLSDLSGLVYYSKPYLSRVETGERNGTLQLALACDRALQAGGELAVLLAAGRKEASAGLGS
jgi:Helix-turn-helix domain